MVWTDLESVAALEEQIYPDTAWTLQTWWAELAQRPRRHYVVAESNERGGSGTALTGYAGLDVNGDNADVMTIAVAPAHRGTGVGAALLQRLHTVAAGQGVTAMLLEVRADNAAARALYDKYGYEHVHTRRGYYQPDGVDAAVLRSVVVPDPTRRML
ncbi:MAG: ribosomal protein S18-alanine N-acetyltransferase [Ornithinimicrobium sp.]